MNQLDMFNQGWKPLDIEELNRQTGAYIVRGPIQPDLDVACQKRDDGIRRVSDNNREFLDIMRSVAKQICLVKGWVCSDDLREHADRHGLKPNHYNAWGAILTTKEFTPGEYIVSKQPQGHANRVRKWVLRDSDLRVFGRVGLTVNVK